MKNNNIKLSFAELEADIEIIENRFLHEIKGGVMWGIDPQGNFYYRESANDDWTFFRNLDVTIYGDTGGGAPQGFQSNYIPPAYTYNTNTGFMTNTEGSGGGTVTNFDNSVMGTYKLNPSLSDGGLIENTGLLWGVAGGVWSGAGGYSVSPGLDGTTRVSTTLSILPPQSFEHPYVVGSIKVSQNGNVIGSSSLGDHRDPNGSYIMEKGALPLDGFFDIPAGITGEVELEIRVGAYDDLNGAGNPGNSKVYKVTVNIPKPYKGPSTGPEEPEMTN